MLKIICDRCGSEVAETADSDDFMRFGHKSAGGVLYPKEFDLCSEWVDNKCSNCGKGIESLIDSVEWYENEKPNYCPFCGIRFKESE